MEIDAGSALGGCWETPQTEEDSVFVTIGTNVGAGIILGGKIHHGSIWSAGEIAYLRLPYILRRRPVIHEFGELETVLTSSGILKSWDNKPIINKGFIKVPDGPGLGITLNDDEVKRHLKLGTGYFEPTPVWDDATFS